MDLVDLVDVVDVVDLVESPAAPASRVDGVGHATATASGEAQSTFNCSLRLPRNP